MAISTYLLLLENSASFFRAGLAQAGSGTVPWCSCCSLQASSAQPSPDGLVVTLSDIRGAHNAELWVNDAGFKLVTDQPCFRTAEAEHLLCDHVLHDLGTPPNLIKHVCAVKCSLYCSDHIEV